MKIISLYVAVLAFTAAADDVIGDPANQHHIGGESLPDDRVHGLQVVGYELAYGVYGHGSLGGGRRAGSGLGRKRDRDGPASRG